MFGPDSKTIAGESGFNGLHSCVRESSSALLCNGLQAGSGLNWSRVRRSHVHIPGTQNCHNIEGKGRPIGHGRTNGENLCDCDRASG